jgi:hypothetical protein
VLFEVGMIQGLVRIPQSVMKHCILIRENQFSPNTPFNFVNDRIIHVPRTNREFDKNEFCKELENSLKTILIS